MHSDSDSCRTWAEVDLGALRHNLRAIRAAVGEKPEILAVIKANAYGHGAVALARALAAEVSYFGVACIDEAEQVFGLGPDTVILSACLPGERARAVERGHIVTVSSAEEARAYASCGAVRINFKIDTGMGRLGCPAEKAAEEIAAAAAIPGITLHSISSHLPASDDDPPFTAEQLERIGALRAEIAPRVPAAKWHVLNSAGIFGFSSHAHDIVRAGLALYGVACPSGFQSLLEPALTWKARIAAVRELPAGSTVSYGRTYRVGSPILAACVAVGYADGYPRQVSGQGAHVLCRGFRCPVLGRVTMDQIIIDVSRFPDVGPGEPVTLIGKEGAEEITATDLAEKAGTIPWHVFTGISGRVRRFYVGG